MPCYKPMLAVPICVSPETGKVQYSFREKFVEGSQLQEVVMLNGKPYPVKALPCGKCVGCRLDYSKEWAIRCTLEMQDYPPDECYFLTLTYDDAHVPYSEARREVFERDTSIDSMRFESFVSGRSMSEIDYVLKEVVDLPSNQTLVSDHLTLFMKRLRRNQEYHYGKQNIRFFGCGEYGGKTFRPHYHLIVYGLQLSPRTSSDWQKPMKGYSVWQSKYLEDIWKYGHVIVGHCTYETCGYVARYMLKKQKGNDGDFYKKNNIEPPFSRMSLKPGLGMKYYEEHKREMLESDEIYISTEKRGIKSKPPRFFDLLLADEYPDTFAEVKGIRSDLSVKNVMAKENETGLPISIILDSEEKSRLARTKILYERNVE